MESGHTTRNHGRGVAISREDWCSSYVSKLSSSDKNDLDLTGKKEVV